MTLTLEHFDGASLPSFLTAVTAGDGVVSVVDGLLTLDGGAAAADAAFVYVNQIIDINKNLLALVCFRDGYASEEYPVVWLVDSDGPPAAGSKASVQAATRLAVEFQGNRFVHKYWSAGHDDHYWNGNSNAWSTLFAVSHNDVSAGAFYVAGIEIDADNGRFRCLSGGKDGSSSEQGCWWHEVTAWAALSALETVADDLYLCFGFPWTDDDDGQGTQDYDWLFLARDEARTYAVLNNDHGFAAFPEDYSLDLYYAYNPDSPYALLLPESNDNTILTTGGPAAWDEVWVARGCIIDDTAGSGNYLLFYDGRDAAGNVRIGLATTTARAGSWTKHGGNPIIGGSGDDFKFPFVVKDPDDAASRRWKMWVGSESDQTIRYYTAASYEGPWSYQGDALAVGAPGAWDDVYVSQPVVVRVGSEYQLWYAGYDGDHWQEGVATATSFAGPWTKAAGNPIIARSAVAAQLDGAVANAVTVTVDDTTGFEAGGLVVFDAGTLGEVHQIRSVDSGTQLTLYQKATYADGTAVADYHCYAVAVSDIRYADGVWYFVGTAFKFNSVVDELATLLYAAGADPKALTFSPRRFWPLVPKKAFDNNAAWSTENPTWERTEATVYAAAAPGQRTALDVGLSHGL